MSKTSLRLPAPTAFRHIGSRADARDQNEGRGTDEEIVGARGNRSVEPPAGWPRSPWVMRRRLEDGDAVLARGATAGGARAPVGGVGRLSL